LKEMGFLSRRANPEAFDRIVQYFHEKMRAQVSVAGLLAQGPVVRLGEEPVEPAGPARVFNVSLADLKDAFRFPKEWILSSARCSSCSVCARRSIPR